MAKPDSYDVVIYELESGKVESIAGKNMRMCGAHNSAQTRLDTVFGRINERYFARIVPAGSLHLGDVVPDEDSDHAE